MSNLLSELCELIDDVSINMVRAHYQGHTEVIAGMYKQRVKKLLIKYEAKDNPNMKVNEVAAELQAFKECTTHNTNYFDERIAELSKELKQLNTKIQTINKDQDNLEYLQLKIKYEEALSALRNIYDHCFRHSLMSEHDPENIPKIKRLDAIGEFALKVLKELEGK